MPATVTQFRPDAWPLASILKLGTLPRSVSTARQHTAVTLSEWNMAHLADDAQIVVSELVTNALVHGAGPVTVRLRANTESLLIEVSDALAAPPEPRHHAADAEGGHGLEIVSALCDSWGCYPDSGGKVVWALAGSRTATGG